MYEQLVCLLTMVAETRSAETWTRTAVPSCGFAYRTFQSIELVNGCNTWPHLTSAFPSVPKSIPRKGVCRFSRTRPGFSTLVKQQQAMSVAKVEAEVRRGG
jgi:hypothetical protein